MIPCSHLSHLPAEPAATSDGCAECLAIGSRWVHLRKCLSCGHVGCCDSSPNRHATAHNAATGHPVIASAESGEHWAWCYPDQLLVQPYPGASDR